MDALRGIAASGVVIVHAIQICPLGVPFYSWSTVYLVLGVPLFFIISAFSMSIAYRTGIGDVGAARRYGLRRILRIAPLFYCSLRGSSTIAILAAKSNFLATCNLQL